MPGYAKPSVANKNLIFSNGTEIYSNKFYGIHYDLITAKLTIQEIDNKSDIIVIPEEEGNYDSNYLYWIWSGTQLKFNWGTIDTGSLIMEVT